jgi:hypothetical protein
MEVTSRRGEVAVDRGTAAPLAPEARAPADKTPGDRVTEPSPLPEARTPAKRPMRIMPFLITLVTVALAALLGWGMWEAYMGAPWTRDATVRADVVTMAPEVAGRIVELHVVDNKFVHKGELLMVIDPINYSIAVSQAEAAVQQAQASVQNVDAQLAVQEAQINASQAALDQAEAVLVFAKQQATRYLWRKVVMAPFKMPSSSRRSCTSRRPRCTVPGKTTIWRSGKSNH